MWPLRPSLVPLCVPAGQGDWTHFTGSKSIYYWALGNPNTLARGGTLSQADLGTAQLATWPPLPTATQRFSACGQRCSGSTAPSCRNRLKGTPSLLIDFFLILVAFISSSCTNRLHDRRAGRGNEIIHKPLFSPHLCIALVFNWNPRETLWKEDEFIHKLLAVFSRYRVNV